MASSASCYDRPEDVRVLAFVVPERKLVQVQRQVVFADFVIGADHATLQQAPKAVQVAGMHVPAHVLMLAVLDHLNKWRNGGNRHAVS